MSEYLSSDKDLLEEIEAIGPMSTGTAFAEQQRKISVLHIKAILRERKSSARTEYSNKRMSVILAAFTMVQIFIGIAQFIIAMKDSDNLWYATFTSALLFAGIIVVLKYINPDKLVKDED